MDRTRRTDRACRVRRLGLLALPTLFVAGCAWGWLTGYGFPILTTGLRALTARADAPDYEAEVL